MSWKREEQRQVLPVLSSTSGPLYTCLPVSGGCVLQIYFAGVHLSAILCISQILLDRQCLKEIHRQKNLVRRG